MKFGNLLIVLAIVSSCNAQIDSQNMEIIYEAVTRGSSVALKATSTEIVYKDMAIDKTIRSVPKSFWKSIKDIVENMDIEEIGSFKAPSDNRIRDAALHATLKIIIGDKIYSSQTFDHGNPPKELKPLMDALFKIVEVK